MMRGVRVRRAGVAVADGARRRAGFTHRRTRSEWASAGAVATCDQRGNRRIGGSMAGAVRVCPLLVTS